MSEFTSLLLESRAQCITNSGRSGVPGVRTSAYSQLLQQPDVERARFPSSPGPDVISDCTSITVSASVIQPGSGPE